MPLNEKLAQLVADFEVIPDPQERLAAVVDRARRQPPLPENQRTDAHRVRGCVSVVWLAGELRDGRCHFRCAADSPVVRGLLALLCDFYGDTAPAEIAASDLDPLAALGVVANLSPTRRNGLASARAAIRDFARAHAAPAL